MTGIDPHVTHVITNTRGTDKVAWAELSGKAVVHVDWLESCSLLWRRAREEDYALRATAGGVMPVGTAGGGAAA